MGWLSNLFGEKPKAFTRLEGDGDFLCEVVGESKYQDALARISGGKTAEGHQFECTALLQPEPRNAYDPHAIVITINGETVGYLSRPHAKLMCAVFKKHNLVGAEAAAMIVGGWTGRTGKKADGHFGVRLDIPV